MSKKPTSRFVAPPPPEEEIARSNLTTGTEEQKDLNFRVPKEFHRRFKFAAMEEDMKMKDFLYHLFDAYQKSKS